jgi:hypothetical protein
MEKKKEFVYFIEVKEKSGNISRYPIYRSGDRYFIDEHPVKKGRGIEEEIKIHFDAEVLGPVLDNPAHQDIKFKDIK